MENKTEKQEEDNPQPIFLGRGDWISESGLARRGISPTILYCPNVVRTEIYYNDEIFYQMEAPICLPEKAQG